MMQAMMQATSPDLGAAALARVTVRAPIDGSMLGTICQRGAGGGCPALQAQQRSCYPFFFGPDEAAAIGARPLARRR